MSDHRVTLVNQSSLCAVHQEPRESQSHQPDGTSETIRSCMIWGNRTQEAGLNTDSSPRPFEWVIFSSSLILLIENLFSKNVLWVSPPSSYHDLSTEVIFCPHHDISFRVVLLTQCASCVPHFQMPFDGFWHSQHAVLRQFYASTSPWNLAKSSFVLTETPTLGLRRTPAVDSMFVGRNTEAVPLSSSSLLGSMLPSVSRSPVLCWISWYVPVDVDVFEASIWGSTGGFQLSSLSKFVFGHVRSHEDCFIDNCEQVAHIPFT